MNKQTAIFGGGCFWCIEAIIQRLKGVEHVESGYSAGDTPNPSYRAVCSGTTGHAEVIKVTFDADVLSYEDLLIVFMTSHDPTTLNRQGADVGTQYRSIIIYQDEAQREIASKVIADLSSSFDGQIVTELVPLDVYYPAEIYHQDYYNRNSYVGYCSVVISPKLTKLRKMYSHLMKEDV